MLRSGPYTDIIEGSLSYLPSGRTVAVALVLEVRYVLHHPLVDLGQGESLFRHRADGLSDEVRVRLVTPGVSPAGRLLDRPGDHTGALLLLRRVQPGPRRRHSANGTGSAAISTHVGDYVQQLRGTALGHLGPAVFGVRSGQGPSVGPGPLLRLQTVFHGSRDERLCSFKNNGRKTLTCILKNKKLTRETG